MSRFMVDQQQALAFLVSQASYIEPTVVEVQYPDIQYANLVPVDTSADEWANSVTYYSSDKVGKADWFHGEASDMPRADVIRAQHEVGIEMAAIGYGYNLEELGKAMRLGIPLTSDKASAARRAYEEKMEEVALHGDATKNFSGLLNYPGIEVILAEADGGSGNDQADWPQKTPDQILRDVNAAITGQWAESKQVELADTVLLPVLAMSDLATRRLGDTNMTILQFLMLNNIYSFTTGRPLTIRAVRGLESVGTGGTGRMIVYRRDPQVLKLHQPMPHRFLPAFQTGPLRFDIPGIFRTAGLDVRRPGAIRYVDGILDVGAS